MQRDPHCDLGVVRQTRCCPPERAWKLGNHASAGTSRISSSPGHTQSACIDDWNSFTRSKIVLSSVENSSPDVPAHRVRNSQYPGSTYVRSTRTRTPSRMSDMSDFTLIIGQSRECQEVFVHAVDEIQSFHKISRTRTRLKVRLTCSWFLSSVA